jgi:hypothetical protein
LALVPEQPSDRTRTELLLVTKRADHPRLVECRRGACRGIGHQQPTLALCARSSPIYQHGHLAVALLAPTGEPLKAVKHLVVAVYPKSDQQREFWSGPLIATGNARP